MFKFLTIKVFEKSIKFLQFLRVHLKTYLASRSRDKVIKIWNIDTAECIRTFTEGREDFIDFVGDDFIASKLTAKRETLFSRRAEKTFLRDIKSGNCVLTFERRIFSRTLATMPLFIKINDENLIRVSGLRGEIECWNLRTQMLNFKIENTEWIVDIKLIRPNLLA